MLLYVALTIYLLGFVLIAYFCLFADPDESRVADVLTRRLPCYLESKVVQLVGKKTMDRLGFFADYFLQIVYLVVVLGSWSIMFHFGYPWITRTDYVANYHKYLGYIVFVMCMASWRYASTVGPGFITARTLAKHDNYPYDNLLFVPGRICPTVGIPRLARSKFDRFSRVHVARFDHFCGWLHNPIGEENYRYFLLFLLVHILMCLYGSVVCARLFWGEIVDKKLLEVTFFNSVTGEEYTGSWTIASHYLFQRHMYMAGVFILMSCMSLVLGAFLGYHVWITSRGMTTNETVKWGQVRKWHRQESKRYEAAVKSGTVSAPTGTANDAASSVVTDGDVTCTGGTATARDSRQPEDESSPIMDPGPMPKNIYNQGLVENWKDVFFPRSLRKETVDRWKRSLHDANAQNSEPAPEVSSNKPKES